MMWIRIKTLREAHSQRLTTTLFKSASGTEVLDAGGRGRRVRFFGLGDR